MHNDLDRRSPELLGSAQAWARAFVAHGGRVFDSGGYALSIPCDWPEGEAFEIEGAPPHTWPLSREHREGALRGLEMVLRFADQHAREDMLEMAFRLSCHAIATEREGRP